jgi:integrase
VTKTVSAVRGVKLKHRDGAWWLYIDHNGRRKARRVGVGKVGKRAAEDAQAVIAGQLAAGDLSIFTAPAPDQDKVLFAQLASEWLATYPVTHNLRESSRVNHGTALKHLVAFFGKRAVSAITPDDVEGFFVAKRRAQGAVGNRRDGYLSDGSMRVTLNTLRLVLDRAVRKRLLSSNPVGEAEITSKQPSGADPFTADEVARILDAAVSPLFRTMLMVWFSTGLRRGELLGLQHGDLDLVRGEVAISRTFSRCAIGDPKTPGSVRVVAFHPVRDPAGGWEPVHDPALVGALGALRRDPEAFLWLGDRPFQEDRLTRYWKATLTRAGVRFRSAEQCRHTWASTLLSRNAPILYVSEQGGWKNGNVLLKHYSKWLPRTRPTPAPQPDATVTQPKLRVVR